MRNTSRLFCTTGSVLALLALAASPVLPDRIAPIEGIRDNTPTVHAVVGARIVQKPGRVIESGTVVMRDGLIVDVGETVNPPEDARIWDGSGLTVYPGLIEPYAHIGLSAADTTDTPHWNPYVRSHFHAADSYAPSKEELEELRSLGFTAALIVPRAGLFHGSSALVNLADGPSSETLVRPDVAQHFALRQIPSRWPPTEVTYPNSLMGTIALARQTLLDAQWYRKAHAAYRKNPRGQQAPELNDALGQLVPVVASDRPFVIEVADDLMFLRALRIAEEFDLQLLVRGSGHEYRILDRVRLSGVSVILPTQYPAAPSIADPADALQVSLAELLHWEAAPFSPARLQEAGIHFAFTADGLKKRSEIRSNVRKAIEHGLHPDDALAAFTTAPAEILGVSHLLGTLEKGKRAHLVVADGDLFGEKTEILDVWIDGERYVVNPRPEVDPRGKWQLAVEVSDTSALSLELTIEGKPKALQGKLLRDSLEIALKQVSLEHHRISLLFPGDSLDIPGVFQLRGSVEDSVLSGNGRTPQGTHLRWHATFSDTLPADTTSVEKPEAPEPPPAPVFPPGAFGFSEPPLQPEHLLITGATIWTSGPSGVIENGDLLVRRGEIAAVGQNLDAPGDAVVIDAAGKHVTPGLIDAHAHITTDGGLNEWAQAVSAEVRIADVLDSYSVDIYRQLAGGTTASHILHGSSNPIGGQCAAIKLRWGVAPRELLLEGAKPTIKFALGENVKRSNWGDRGTTRYPQTRMGVEQIIRDRLEAALDYEQGWKDYENKGKKGRIPPRVDLELEALLEVLRGERLVHCHSYRQDEILMLMRVAEDFGFTIGTFQHVLEGYKIAEVLKKHGAHASTFSDWWAYKFEVYDAIPYNAALMHRVGVGVSLNSDSRELGRRLNTEAVKAVKYGGVSEEEALHFITINPARQIGAESVVGSLEPGKDADFAIWNAPPLSAYARCEQTWVDGRKYFDREADLNMRKGVEAERARLIQKVLSAEKQKGGKDEKEKK